MQSTELSNDALIGFLTIREAGAQAWDGAYLVTDLRGNPSRFCRSSEPVRLERRQAILLGKGLHRHVFVDVLGRSLVTQDGPPVAAIIVDDRHLLDLRRFVDVPIGLWRENGLVPADEQPSDRAVLEAVAERLDLIDGPLEVFERLQAALREPVDGE